MQIVFVITEVMQYEGQDVMAAAMELPAAKRIAKELSGDAKLTWNRMGFTRGHQSWRSSNYYKADSNGDMFWMEITKVELH